jgi:NADPH:quinone reductase-like Zn-dependent oxidoreductase
MKAAIVTKAGATPVYGDFNEPRPSTGEVRIAVTAAALSPVVKSRASGAHYSATTAFPFVVGIDGVGRLDDGRRVYFILPKAPLGSMAEQTVVASSHCVPLPDGLDDATAAAIANPGLSSWAAFKERARFKAGETVLVNGATGTSGRLAVRIAKFLGARKVVATGRNAAALEALKPLGADATIALDGNWEATEAAFREHITNGVDVVLDYLWGKSAEHLLAAIAKSSQEGVPIRFVQIGHSSGANITLSAPTLRSAAIELMGSGLGSVALPRIVKTVDELMHAAVKGHFEIATRPVPLAEVERTWPADTGTPRIVFTIGEGGR